MPRSRHRSSGLGSAHQTINIIYIFSVTKNFHIKFTFFFFFYCRSFIFYIEALLSIFKRPLVLYYYWTLLTNCKLARLFAEKCIIDSTNKMSVYFFMYLRDRAVCLRTEMWLPTPMVVNQLSNLCVSPPYTPLSLSHCFLIIFFTSDGSTLPFSISFSVIRE